MKELTSSQVMDVSGGKFRFHFNLIQTVFTAIGAGIVSGPFGAGLVIAAAIATQGAGNLHDLYIDEYGNKVDH